MEHPFFPTTTNRAEAIQYLSIAEKLLSSRDLVTSKSFATRAHESDPTLRQPDLILAVVDTLLAAERRIGNNQPDWYSVLRLPPPQPNVNISTLLASQYRSLVLLLNPQVNKYPYADQAYRIVMDAYGVISDPVRKTMYDKELAFYLQQQNRPDPFSPSLPTMQQNFVLFGGAAAASSGLSQFSQVQVHQVQPRVESMGMGSTREQVAFGSSGANFMFGSGSGSGWGSSMSHKPVQESFQGFGNMGHAAEQQNIGRLNTDDRQRQQQVHESFMFNAGGGRNGHDINVNVNVSGNNNKTVDFGNVGENHGSSGRYGNDVNFGGNFSSRNGNFVHVSDVNVNGSNGANVSQQNVGDNGEREGVEEEEENVGEPVNEEVDDDGADGDESTFWTACPYCYYMYEYPSKYVDCTLRCQTCKVAFQAVVIASPPPVEDGEDAYFCCWGFFPLGISKEYWNKVPGASSAYSPFSSMYTAPSRRGNRKGGGAWRDCIYIDDDDVSLEEDTESEEFDDIDWQKGIENKRVVRIPNKYAKRMRVSKGKHANGKKQVASPDSGSARRQPVRAARSSGKLDLNEMSKEAEEPAARVKPRNGHAGGEHDNAEGNGFFEGLDDFLSSIPILNCDGGEDKGVKVA